MSGIYVNCGSWSARSIPKVETIKFNIQVAYHTQIRKAPSP